jgi:hypothetical protein
LTDEDGDLLIHHDIPSWERGRFYLSQVFTWDPLHWLVFSFYIPVLIPDDNLSYYHIPPGSPGMQGFPLILVIPRLTRSLLWQNLTDPDRVLMPEKEKQR